MRRDPSRYPSASALATRLIKTRAAGKAAGREDIILSAIDLFSTRGYDLVSVKDIASSAKLTIGALYHHFASKQVLYEAAMLRVLSELPDPPDAQGVDTRVALEELIRWITVVISTDSTAAQILRREFTDARLPRPISEFSAFRGPLESFSTLISELVPGINVPLAEATITAILFGIVGLPGLRRIAPHTIFSSDDPGEIAKSICSIVLSGVGSVARR